MILLTLIGLQFLNITCEMAYQIFQQCGQFFCKRRKLDKSGAKIWVVSTGRDPGGGASVRGEVTSWDGARPGDGQRRVETGNRGGTKRVAGRHRSRWRRTRQPRPRQRGRGQRREGYRDLGLIVDGVRAEGQRGDWAKAGRQGSARL